MVYHARVGHSSQYERGARMAPVVLEPFPWTKVWSKSVHFKVAFNRLSVYVTGLLFWRWLHVLNPSILKIWFKSAISFMLCTHKRTNVPKKRTVTKTTISLLKAKNTRVGILTYNAQFANSAIHPSGVVKWVVIHVIRYMDYRVKA